jgi:hypothetical protein
VTLGLIAGTDCLLYFLPASFRFWQERWAILGHSDPSMEDKSQAAGWKVPDREFRAALDLGATSFLPDLRETGFGSWPVAASFGFLGLVQVVLLVILLPRQTAGDLRFANPWSGSMNASRLQALKIGDLPAHSGAFRREAFMLETRSTGSSVGEISRFWRYKFRNTSAIVSVDFPFKPEFQTSFQPNSFPVKGFTRKQAAFCSQNLSRATLTTPSAARILPVWYVNPEPFTLLKSPTPSRG